eukprot:gene11164-3985_t
MSKPQEIDDDKTREYLEILKEDPNLIDPKHKIPDLYLMELIISGELQLSIVASTRVFHGNFNLGKHDKYYMKKLLEQVFHSEPLDTKVAFHSRDLIVLFARYIVQKNKLEYLKLLQTEIEMIEKKNFNFRLLLVFFAETTATIGTKLDGVWMKFYSFLFEYFFHEMDESEKIVQTFIYEIIRVIGEGCQTEEEFIIFCKLFLHKNMSKIQLNPQSVVIMMMIINTFSFEDVLRITSKVVKKMYTSEPAVEYFEFLICIHEEFPDKFGDQKLSLLPFLVKKSFELQELELKQQSENVTLECLESQNKILECLGSLHALLNAIFEAYPEKSQESIIPMLKSYFESGDEQMMIRSVKIITEFSENNFNNLDFANLLIKTLKSKKLPNYHMLMALNSYIPVILKNELFDDLKLIYELAVELFENDNDETLAVGPTTVANILRVANDAKVNLKYDFDELLKITSKFMKSTDVQNFVKVLVEVFNEFNKFDTKSDTIAEIMNLIIKNAETHEFEEVRNECFHCLQFLVDYLKFDANLWYSKVINLALSRLKETVTSDTDPIQTTDCLLLLLILLQNYGDHCEYYISKSGLVDLTLNIIKSDSPLFNEEIKYLSMGILIELCYMKSRTLELSLDKIYKATKNYKPKTMSKICFDIMVLHFFQYDSLKQNVPYYIDKCVKAIVDEEFMDNVESEQFQIYAFPILSIAVLLKLNFKEVDNRFEEFGLNFTQAIKLYKPFTTEIELTMLYDALYELVSNNLTFSNSYLFPENDIQSLKDKSQIYLLMNGRYFNLIPTGLKKSCDVNFVFK